MILSTQATSDIVRTASVASLPFLQELLGLCYDLRWLMGLCAVLVIADLKFGIENSKSRKVPIRISNAARRTINKAVDYTCWIFVAGFMGKAIAEPFGISSLVVAAIVIILASAIEIDSIIQNYFEARGVYGMSLHVIVTSWLRIRKADQAAEVLDEAASTISKSHHEGDSK